MGLVVLPMAAAGVLQAVVAPRSASTDSPWADNALLGLGTPAFTIAFAYRSSVWYLGIVWTIDRSRDVEARLAVAEERLRFSRDLHDVLGRNLALIAVSSDLAGQLLRRGQDGAIDHVEAVHRTAQNSMRELREVVAGYRTVDLDAELAGARSVLRAAAIDVRVIGDGSGLAPGTQAALAWVVREAVTNIIRHSDAGRATISLDVTPTPARTAVLRIENDGVPARPPCPAPHGAHGTGLRGLRERLAGIGGTLSAELMPGNRFRVEACLPLADEPAVARPQPLS